jgi:outer membrane protein OmpA-like peptidoglycan-associated protein/uncharacterized protein YcfL
MKNKILSVVVASILLGGCSATKEQPENTIIDQVDLIQELALHDAVRAKNLSQVQMLVENKSKVNLKDQYGYTPLHIAVRLNQYEISEYLINHGAQVNSVDIYEDTPLLDSTRDDYTELSKLLLCNGADINVKDKYDMTPLHYSSKNSNELISEMILADDLNPYCNPQQEEPEPMDDLAETLDPIEPAISGENQTNNSDELTLAETPAFKGLYEALQEEFQDDFDKWNAELTKDDLMFRFNNPAAIFEVGDSSLKEGFTDILTDFFPRYLKVLTEYKENIEEVRIEGHTSSEYTSAKNDTQRYEMNKTLSEKRAKAVRDYVVTTIADENKQWAEETFKAYGMAYDDLIYNPDGTENKIASRRVDFKIIKKEQ